MDRLDDILTDATLWDFTDAGVPFVIYSDIEIESMDTEPERPFIVIGTRNTGVIPKWLPFIGVDIEVDYLELQLGTPDSRIARTTLNIMGRQQGEASRIGSVVKSNMMSFTASGGQHVQAVFMNGAVWHETAVPIPIGALKERTLAQWIAVSAGFHAL